LSLRGKKKGHFLAARGSRALGKTAPQVSRVRRQPNEAIHIQRRPSRRVEPERKKERPLPRCARKPGLG